MFIRKRNLITFQLFITFILLKEYEIKIKIKIKQFFILFNDIIIIYYLI